MTTLSTLIPLSRLIDFAVRLLDYRTDDTVCMIPANPADDGAPAFASPLEAIPSLEDISARACRRQDYLGIIFLRPGTDLDAPKVRGAVAHLEAIGAARRASGAVWNTIAAVGAVQPFVYADGRWLSEPDLDRQDGTDLRRRMVQFDVPLRPPNGPVPTVDEIRVGRAAWQEALEARLSGDVAEAPEGTALKAGSVRDTVLVWSIGRSGSERHEPGDRFVPPTHEPDPARIGVAYDLLASRVASAEAGDALGCAAYLAWWSGHQRLATYLVYEAGKSKTTTRLAELVWRAMNQHVRPPWMG